MNDFSETTVEGHTVSVTDDGKCWWCEDGEPTIASRIGVASLVMDIGVCENCHTDLEEHNNE